MKFIEIKNCSKVYKNGVTAIADLNLEIKKGEFVFVIGATASGKSTLIKMLYREEKPTRLACSAADNDCICAVRDLILKDLLKFLIIYLTVFVHRCYDCNACSFKNCHLSSSFFLL